MTSNSCVIKKKVDLKFINSQLVKNGVCLPPKYKAYPEIVMKGDPLGALSSTPPIVINIHDVRSCYMCKVGEVGDYKLRLAYEKICEERVLKEQHKCITKKRWTQALKFLRNFKVEQIKIVLRRIRAMKLWLEIGPVKLTKKIIHHVTG
jgi:hypothetical protein